jgi:hypothetical protein
MNIHEYRLKHGEPIGNEVAINSRTFGYYVFGKITKVSPSGQITVTTDAGTEKRFAANGNGFGHGGWLEFDVAAARRHNAERDALVQVRALNEPSLLPVSRYATKQELLAHVQKYEEMVAKARAAVEAIPDEEE